MKSILRSPVFTVVLFVLAAALLGFGSVGAVQAAPRVQSGDFRAEVELSSVQTALLENGTVVEGDNALLGVERFRTPNNIASDGSNFKIGMTYNEVLAVRNVGKTDEYVRVTVRKYWADANGKVIKDVDPALIKLSYPSGSGWTRDTTASTEEREILYYDRILAAGTDSNAFVDGITIDGNVVNALSSANKLTYEGLQFKLDVTVDAVQTHNGDAAMKGAWGRTV